MDDTEELLALVRFGKSAIINGAAHDKNFDASPAPTDDEYEARFKKLVRERRETLDSTPTEDR